MVLFEILLYFFSLIFYCFLTVQEELQECVSHSEVVSPEYALPYMIMYKDVKVNFKFKHQFLSHCGSKWPLCKEQDLNLSWLLSPIQIVAPLLSKV